MSNYYTNINISSYLSVLDWLVFLLCSLSCIAVTIYGQHRKKKLQTKNAANNSVLEYLLMGRQLTLPLFVTTLVTTWYGGIFGVTQIAFEQGIYNFVTQGVFWYVAYIFFAFYLVKKIRSYGAFTLPELISNLYSSKSAKVTAVFLFIKTLPITYAISIGIFLQCVFPISLAQATIAGVAIIVVYAVSGGLRTVIYADVALFVVMCLGVSLVLIFSVLEFGGLSFLVGNLPHSYFKPCGTKSVGSTFVWLLIACSTTFISPCFYQRCLAAVDDKVAVRGILISSLIWLIFDVCSTFGAMYARAILPAANSIDAYVVYGVQLLPTGFKGLLLASICAAIIATLDAFLFIASNILFYDLPIFKFKDLRLQHFFAIVTTAILTVIMALHFEGKIENAWLMLKSYFTAVLLLPLLFGYYAPRLANGTVFITNAIVSCVSITLWNYWFAAQFPGIESFYIGCIASCVVFAANYLVHHINLKLSFYYKSLSLD